MHGRVRGAHVEHHVPRLEIRGVALRRRESFLALGSFPWTRLVLRPDQGLALVDGIVLAQRVAVELLVHKDPP